jgi:hypothetical protein
MPETDTTPAPRDVVLAEADRILAAMEPPIVRWMQSQGLEPADAASDVHWAGMLKHLKSQGTWDSAKLWMESQAPQMVKRWSISKRTKVCREILRRFCRAMMDKTGPPPRMADPIAGDDEMACLPSHIRWVVRHPGLRLNSNKSGCCEKCNRPFKDPVAEAVAEAYESANECPSEAARTLYEHARLDPDRVDSLFKEVNKLLAAESKRKKGAGESEADKEEKKRISDMEKMRKELVGMAEKAKKGE